MEKKSFLITKPSDLFTKNNVQCSLCIFSFSNLVHTSQIHLYTHSTVVVNLHITFNTHQVKQSYQRYSYYTAFSPALPG